MSLVTDSYDAGRAAELRRARRTATGLLLLATAVFAATFLMGDATWVHFLRTTAEASMIGGLADWFAVVALFRHPLGIPIPHTAVIPKSKDGLARSLGEFVRHNFLAPDHIVERLAGARLPHRLGEWLAVEANAEKVAGPLTLTAAAVVEGLDSDAIEADIERAVTGRLTTLPVAELLGRTLEAAMAGGQHQPLLSAAIGGIGAALDDNRPALRRRLGEESPWWVPEAVDDAVFDRAYGAVSRLLADLAADPDHEIRRAIDERLAELATRLRNDPEVAKSVMRRVEELAGHPEVRRWARGTWSSLAQSTVEAARRPDSALRRRIVTTLGDLGRRLTDDAELARRLDTWMISLAEPLAEAGQRELGDLIAATVDRWDPDETSRRLELWMGRDLQFVRINGTVVGALAGLAIHTVVFLLGG